MVGDVIALMNLHFAIQVIHEILDWDKATEHLEPINMEAFMKVLADPNFEKNEGRL